MSLVVKNEKISNFMNRMGLLMEDPEFRSFFDEYFNNIDDIKAIIMLMQGYRMIDDYLKQSENYNEITYTDKIICLKKLMLEKDFRQNLVTNFNNNKLDPKFQLLLPQ